MPPKTPKTRLAAALAAAERRASGDEDEEAEEMDTRRTTNNNNAAKKRDDPPLISSANDVNNNASDSVNNLGAASTNNNTTMKDNNKKKTISFDPEVAQKTTTNFSSVEKGEGAALRGGGGGSFPPVNEAWAFQPTTTGHSDIGHDDDVGGYPTGSPSAPSGSGGSNSDEDLQGMSAGDSTSSASSMSSNARRSKEIAARPMMLYMVSLIMVPITFLAIYQGLSVGFSLSTLSYMHDHELSVEHMLELERNLQLEMVHVSKLIGLRRAYGVDGELEEIPSWVPDEMKTLWEGSKREFADSRASLANLLLEVSNGDGSIPEFHDIIIGLPQLLSLAEMAANRNQGQLYRNYLISVQEELTIMIAVMQRNQYAEKFALELSDLQLMSRVLIQSTYLVSMYHEVKNRFNGSSTLLYNAIEKELTSTNGSLSSIIDCSEFAGALGKIDSLQSYIIKGSGNAALAESFKKFNSGFEPLKQSYLPFARREFQNFTFVNDSVFDAQYESVERIVEVAELTLFLKIVDNEDVKHSAVVEGMKLLAAVLACVIGVAILIWIQTRERKELLQIIDHADKLAAAVRRFVPKNQLRMMGIRTVLQVEAGYSTEVAQGLVYNSMRNFTEISQQMSRTELFEWLQMFVARMTYVVQQQRGYLDSILGDSTFSVFPQAIDAVGASILMQQETDHMNIDLVAQRQTDLVRIGIGVHFAVICSGVLGDENRLSCTMVASDVNLSQRLQDLTINYGNRIMLSRAVIDQIDADSFECRSLGAVDTLAEKNLEIYDLYQADPPVLKAFKNNTREDFELAVRLARSDKAEEKQAAKDIFEQLIEESEELQIVDVAMLRKIGELEMHIRGVTGEATHHPVAGLTSINSIIGGQPSANSILSQLAGGMVSFKEASTSGDALVQMSHHGSATGVLARSASRQDLVAATNLGKVSMQDADGEGYEALLRKSSMLREKRKNSLQKRSPSLQALDIASFGSQTPMSHGIPGNTSSGTPTSLQHVPPSANQLQQQLQQQQSSGQPSQQPSSGTTDKQGGRQTHHLSNIGSQTGSNVTTQGSNLGSVAARSSNNTGGTGGGTQSSGQSPAANPVQAASNFLSPHQIAAANDLSGITKSPTTGMLRIGSDFAPRVQSFGYSSVAPEEKKQEYLARYQQQYKR